VEDRGKTVETVCERARHVATRLKPGASESGWQSRRNAPMVIPYIQNQREHHRKKTFQEEYRGLFEKHGIQ